MFSFRVEKNAQSRIDQIAEVIAELKDPMTVEPAKVANLSFNGMHIYLPCEPCWGEITGKPFFIKFRNLEVWFDF